MKKFHGIESILTKIEKEENIEENFGELEDSEFQPRKAGKKSGRQKCPINPCSKSFKGRFSERMGCKSSAIFFFQILQIPAILYISKKFFSTFYTPTRKYFIIIHLRFCFQITYKHSSDKTTIFWQSIYL